MAKKRPEQPHQEFTKRQLSQWQRQKRIQRITIIGGLCVLVAVVGIILGGLYFNEVRPMHETVIKVNDTKLNMGYYIEMLKYYATGGSTAYSADQVVQIIAQNELIKQEAAQLGVTVSNDEIDEQLEAFGLPVNDAYRDIMGVQLLVSKLRDDYFTSQLPATAEQRQIMAIFVETEAEANGVLDSLNNGEDFATLAAELSIESISRGSSGDMGWHCEGALAALLETSVLGDYAFSADEGVLSQPLYDSEVTKDGGYWLLKVIEISSEDGTYHVHGLLLGSEEEALAARARIEAGEDLDLLAEELSQHESSADYGCLGWLSEGTMSAVVDEYVFDPEVEMGKVSQPIRDDTVQSKGGYWVVKVVGIEADKELNSDDKSLLTGQALNDWVAAVRDNPDNVVENYMDNNKMYWALERAYSS